MKREFRFLVLLVVLGAFCTATANAGVDTPGQFRARQVIKSSESFTPPTVPTFFAVGLTDFVAVGQPVVLYMVDLAVGEDNLFFVCRQSQCFEPVANGGRLVDTVPPQSDGEWVTYQVVKTSKDGLTVLDWGYPKARVGFAPTQESLIGSRLVTSVEPFVVQPCRNPPVGAYCPMVWLTEPNYLRITSSGNYPANTSVFVLATAKDGSTGRSAVAVGSSDEDASSVIYVIPRTTYRLSPISITEFETSTRTFRTLVDVIPPVLPTGAGTADR